MQRSTRKSVLAFATLIGLSSLTAVVQAATINTPTTATECQPLSLAWTNADPNGSVYLTVLPGKDISATPLIQFTPQPATGSGSGTLLWPQVNLTAGTQFTLSLNDASGNRAYSSQVTVQQGTGNTCNATSGPQASSTGAPGTSGGASGGSTTPPPSTTPPSSTTTTHTSTTPPPSNTSGGSGSSSGGSTSSGTSAKPNGAMVTCAIQPFTIATIAVTFGLVMATQMI